MKNRHRTVTAVLILSLLFSIIFLPSFEGAREHYVTDTKSGENFTVTEYDGEVTINAKDKESSIFIDSEIVDICCFDTVFTFLCTTEMAQDDFVYTIYTYNARTGALTSFATDCKAIRNNGVFAADGMGRVYVLNYYSSTVVKYFENGKKINDIECNSNILQMMCVDKGCILLFAVDGVYLLEGTSAIKLSSLVPVTPCVYIEDGIIADNVGSKYIYDANSFDVYQQETENASKPSEYEGDVQINHRDKCITVSAGTTVTNLLNFLGLNTSEVTFEKADGSAVTSGKLGTGMVIFAGNTPYSIAVKGDLTGEGNVNSRDLDALMEHLTGEITLGSNFANAADLHKDNKITTKDLLALSRLY